MRVNGKKGRNQTHFRKVKNTFELGRFFGNAKENNKLPNFISCDVLAIRLTLCNTLFVVLVEWWACWTLSLNASNLNYSSIIYIETHFKISSIKMSEKLVGKSVEWDVRKRMRITLWTEMWICKWLKCSNSSTITITVEHRNLTVNATATTNTPSNERRSNCWTDAHLFILHEC